MIAGYGKIATAVNAVKLGAVDYLSKSVGADDFAAALLARESCKVEQSENPMLKTECAGNTSGASTRLCDRNVTETALHGPPHAAVYAGNARAQVKTLTAKLWRRYCDSCGGQAITLPARARA